jgi:hypothetical protein
VLWGAFNIYCGRKWSCQCDDSSCQCGHILALVA